MGVVGPNRQKRLLQPITTHRNGERSQSELKVMTWNRHKARENTRVQITIGFSFAYHWLTKWWTFCWPITEWTNRSIKRVTMEALICNGIIIVVSEYMVHWMLRDYKTLSLNPRCFLWNKPLMCTTTLHSDVNLNNSQEWLKRNFS